MDTADRFARKHGATGGAYALLVGLISVVALAAVTETGSSIDDLFGDTATVMANVTENSENALPAPSADTMPDAFGFGDVSGAAKGTLVASDIVQITGLSDPASAAISGAGSPQFRICADAACSSELADYASSGNVNNDEYIQLQLTSASTDNTSRQATMNIGGVAANWTVTSGTCIGSGSQSFTSPGTYTHSIPANLSACTFSVTVKGAGGGADGSGSNNEGGHGGGASFNWVPGSAGTMNILVGGGGATNGNWGIPPAGGFGGGGTASPTEGAGGGASAIEFMGAVIAISGGGGGGSNHGDCTTPGGAGGGGNNPGQAGGGCGTNTKPGGGGNAGVGGSAGSPGFAGHDCTAGGNAGAAAAGVYGGPGLALFDVGGGGSSNTDNTSGGGSSSSGCDGGGGGYGGGGGGLNGGGGGGGYLNTSVTSNLSIIQGGTGGQNSNNVGADGEVSFSWAP